MEPVHITIEEAGRTEKGWWVECSELSKWKICVNLAEVHAYIDRMIVLAALKSQKVVVGS